MTTNLRDNTMGEDGKTDTMVMMMTFMPAKLLRVIMFQYRE